MLRQNINIALNEFLHFLWILFLIVLAVSVLSGLLREFINTKNIRDKLGLSKKSGVFIGVFLGMLTPFCSASAVPLVMNMISIGTSFSTIVSFIISAPLLNFVVLGIVFVAYGWKITLFYFLWIFVSAVIAGLIIGKTSLQNDVKKIDEKILNNLNPEENFTSIESYLDYVIMTNTAYIDGGEIAKNEQKDTVNTIKNKPNLRIRFVKSGVYATSILFHILPYVFIGALISAVAAIFLPSEIVSNYIGGQSMYAIPLAAAVGIPLYLRIEVAIPLLGVMLGKGMGAGAAIALLIGGTGASLPELTILSSILKLRAVLVFALTVFVIAVSAGFVFQFIGFSFF
jgi:uncharacterized membrane protein YraQ (UPF0718 family)